MNFPTIMLLMLAVLAVGVWGVWEFGRGLDHRAELAARGARGYDERRVLTRMDRLDQRLRRTTLGRQLAKRLGGAGLRMRLSTFVVVVGGGGLVGIALLGYLFSAFLGVLVVIILAAVGLIFLRQQEERRRDEFIAQLPELARVLGNATAAGLSIRTAVDMAADELDEPARTELTRTAEALRLGQSFDEAMNDLRDRLPSRELAVLVSTLVVASRAGGSLITSLRNISTTLEERKETRREVKTILGQSLAVGYSITGMGVALLIGIAVVAPEIMNKMTGSLFGQIVLVVVVSLFGAALMLFRRITRIDV
ncbi:type II secretion system F family protein [Spirillospora sp. NPDC029432]|uniref:type II secretion system F family protein n=1 Tax=Spirillospora sp. NPDC029432 TaxID=3154599 RepID=UPI003452B0C7